MRSTRPAPPSPVRWIARTLEAAGYETWTVGGAVRDVLSGRPAGDWDLATRARPADVRRLFRRTVPLGVEHGTVGVLSRDGTMFEVTTFRRDVDTDGRRARVAFAERIEEDLARRDFTINAIAWHPLREEMLDPFDGVGDLERGVLRTVGRPEERFREDRLRVLRALRFAGLFGLTVEEETWAALREAACDLSPVSAERIRDELLKVLGADSRPSEALRLYAESGVLDALFPELARARTPPGWEEALAVLDALPRGRPLLRLAALLDGVPEREGVALLLRLRLPGRDADRVARHAAAPRPPPPGASGEAVRRWLSRVGAEDANALFRIHLARERSRPGGDPHGSVSAWRAARSVLAERPPLSVGDLALDGRDLIALGLRPGPRFGRILARLLDRVLEDPSSNRKDVLEVEARRLAEAPGGDDDGRA